MKTFSELKRNADTGKYFIEMIYWYGNELPERLKGVRQIIGSKTKSIVIKNLDGKISELRIENTNLIEISETSLTVYNSGIRELTQAEQDILKDWEVIASNPDNVKQAETDMLTDGSVMFWKKKYYFEGKGYGYLLGHEKERGEKYDHNTDKIKSDKVKGEMILQYRLTKAE
jgi:hypothetical protein